MTPPHQFLSLGVLGVVLNLATANPENTAVLLVGALAIPAEYDAYANILVG